MRQGSRWWAVGIVCVGLTAVAKPPAPAADPDDDEYPLDDWAEDAGSAASDDDADPPKVKAPLSDSLADPTKKHRGGADDLTDDQAAALGLGSICCCGVVLIGIIALVVWAVRRSSKPVASHSGSVPPATAPPGAMQLSIFALGIEPQAREVVEQQLAQLGISTVPTNPETRGRLVREAARGLLTVQPSWRQFGYGEKPNLADLAAAETSYRAASDDFRSRAIAVTANATGGGELVVVTLLICSRRSLLGVSRLDDPQQVRTLLEDRMQVADADLLGAELLWAPAVAGGGVSVAEIGLRFPEMMPLIGRAI